MIANAMDPARQTDGVTHVGFVQIGTGMAAIGVHFLAPLGLMDFVSSAIHKVARVMSRAMARFAPFDWGFSPENTRFCSNPHEFSRAANCPPRRNARPSNHPMSQFLP